MADEEHLEILRKGAWRWNEWRLSNSSNIIPNLEAANLKGTDLSSFYLSQTNLMQANLNYADLYNLFNLIKITNLRIRL